MTSLATIPPRTSICLDCRTALVDGEACDGGKKHRVTSLATHAGRQKLLDEVWGPANVRRQLKRATRSGGGGAIGGSILDGCGSGADCSGCDVPSGGGEILGAILVIIVGAIVVIVLGWLVMKLVAYIREKMNRPKPFGALAEGPKMRGRGVRGKVVAAQRSDSPIDDEPCVAYALEYRAKRVVSGAVMLRDAATRGFDVVTTEGRKVRVPAGRIRLDGRPSKIGGSDARMNAAAHVGAIDAQLDTNLTQNDPTEDPFPWDEVVQTVLAPGDEVEVLGDLAPTADPEAASAYRESASLLVPVGVPRLVKISG